MEESNALLTPAELAAGVLSCFPPEMRTAVVEDAEFQQEFRLTIKTTITLNPSGVSLLRNELFDAARQVIGGAADKVAIPSTSGWQWHVERGDDGRSLVLTREGKKVPLPDFSCFAPDAETRTGWFGREAAKFQLNDARARTWREILTQRPAEDEEYDKIISDIRLTPIFVAAGITNHLRLQTLHLRELVPSDIRYYERLVGAVQGDAGLMDFIETTIPPLVASLREWQPLEGTLRAFLLCSHLSIAHKIKLDDLSREDVVWVYDWLEKSGDRLSQLAGIECGLASLGKFPELEPVLTRLVRTILDDATDAKQGRFALLSGLIVLVDGELTRIGIMQGRPVFWRRLAAIAHASVIERQIIAYGLAQETFINWGFKGRGHLFFMQSFLDMRKERRWIPDFVLPYQLKPEFVGRIVGAARAHDALIKTDELRNALFGTKGDSAEASMVFPLSFLPGPLEGGVEAVMEMPQEIEDGIRQDLQALELTPLSFARLVNSTLIFKMGPQLAQLAAEALRQTKHQLRAVRLQKESFALLSGLATVSAVTRSVELASEVRILARAVRRSPGVDIAPDEAMRICLIAAAAYPERAEWCRFVGEWATELAYEDMPRESAAALHDLILVLCQLEPQLWETAARAEAACSAYLASPAA
jgi:hypothetical protein